MNLFCFILSFLFLLNNTFCHVFYNVLYLFSYLYIELHLTFMVYSTLYIVFIQLFVVNLTGIFLT